MGRNPCCAKEGLNRGAWTALEDKILSDYIKTNGEGKWRNIPKQAGLKRCGKSCRLRWLNYLRPDIKRGNITKDEEDLIIRLHRLLGNRWSLIAGRLPGRTDNEIKNYWNSNIAKRSEHGKKKKMKKLNELICEDPKEHDSAPGPVGITTLPQPPPPPQASSGKLSPPVNDAIVMKNVQAEYESSDASSPSASRDDLSSDNMIADIDLLGILESDFSMFKGFEAVGEGNGSDGVTVENWSGLECVQDDFLMSSDFGSIASQFCNPEMNGIFGSL